MWGNCKSLNLSMFPRNRYCNIYTQQLIYMFCMYTHIYVYVYIYIYIYIFIIVIRVKFVQQDIKWRIVSIKWWWYWNPCGKLTVISSTIYFNMLFYFTHYIRMEAPKQCFICSLFLTNASRGVTANTSPDIKRLFAHSNALLTRLSLDSMAAISPTIFSDAFSWMKNFVFWSKFQRSLFPSLQLKITQHLFR